MIFNLVKNITKIITGIKNAKGKLNSGSDLSGEISSP